MIKRDKKAALIQVLKQINTGVRPDSSEASIIEQASSAAAQSLIMESSAADLSAETFVVDATLPSSAKKSKIKTKSLEDSISRSFEDSILGLTFGDDFSGASSKTKQKVKRSPKSSKKATSITGDSLLAALSAMEQVDVQSESTPEHYQLSSDIQSPDLDSTTPESAKSAAQGAEHLPTEVESVTARLIDEVILKNDITQINDLLTLPDAEQYLVIGKYDVPGIFWLAKKTATDKPIAIFKTGPMRGLNDLLLNKLAGLLGMESFFPQSIVAGINLKKFFSPQIPRPESFAKREISEDTDLNDMTVLTLDKRYTYPLSQNSLTKSTMVVGTLQEYVQESREPIKPIHAARIMIFAYLLYIKDLKLQDGGIINCTDGFPKLVDVAENALMYSSVILPDDTETEKDIVSMGIPCFDNLKDLKLSFDDITELCKQFNSEIGKNFATNLLTLLAKEDTQIKLLEEVLEQPKDITKVEFHEGHSFVANETMASILSLRMERIIKQLGKLKEESGKLIEEFGKLKEESGETEQPTLKIFELVAKLDPIYAEAYNTVAAVSKGSDCEGTLSASFKRLCSSSPPASFVGGRTTPYTPTRFIQKTLDDLSGKLFTAANLLFKDASNDRICADKLISKLRKRTNELQECLSEIDKNNVASSASAFPYKKTQTVMVDETIEKLSQTLDTFPKTKENLHGDLDKTAMVMELEKKLRSMITELISARAKSRQSLATPSPLLTTSFASNPNPISHVNTRSDASTPELKELSHNVLNIYESFTTSPSTQLDPKKDGTVLPSAAAMIMPLEIEQPATTPSKERSSASSNQATPPLGRSPFNSPLRSPTPIRGVAEVSAFRVLPSSHGLTTEQSGVRPQLILGTLFQGTSNFKPVENPSADLTGMSRPKF